MFRKLIIMYGVLRAEITSLTAADEDGERRLNPAFGLVCGAPKDDPKPVDMNTTFLLLLIIIVNAFIYNQDKLIPRIVD